jgi:type III pantothenate kinase
MKKNQNEKEKQHNLVIDVGNTLTKVSVFVGDEMIYFEKYSEFNQEIFKKIVIQFSISKVIVSSVGEFPLYIDEFISQEITLIRFSSKTPLPIRNCYKTPSTLGSDRLAAAIGASALYPNQNILTIDCGTAITYDLVTSNGEYLGGAISPGIEMRFKALNQFTAKLPLISFNNSFRLIGDSTETSILSGVLNGVISEVDGYIDRVKGQYSPLNVVFTGGDSFFFDKKLKNSIFVHPNLVVFGLNRILEHNEN